MQGTLDLPILQMVSLAPTHGSAVAQRLNQIPQEARQVNQGSLYPALYRLAKREWLRSEWRTGRDATFYVLTTAVKGGWLSSGASGVASAMRSHGFLNAAK